MGVLRMPDKTVDDNGDGLNMVIETFDVFNPDVGTTPTAPFLGPTFPKAAADPSIYFAFTFNSVVVICGLDHVNLLSRTVVINDRSVVDAIVIR